MPSIPRGWVWWAAFVFVLSFLARPPTLSSLTFCDSLEARQVTFLQVFDRDPIHQQIVYRIRPPKELASLTHRS